MARSLRTACADTQTMTWAERMASDKTLADFVQAEIARAGIALDTARYNEAHWRDCAMKADEKLAAYVASDKKRPTSRR